MHTEHRRDALGIAVTGSTGHLGSVLIPMLLEQGYWVSCLFRKDKLDLESSQINWVQGQLHESNRLESLLEGASVLIHCASLISVGVGNNKEVLSVNVEGTQNLIDLCLKKKIRLVYISSSTATLPAKGKKTLDAKSSRVSSQAFYYGWTKAQAEQKILEAVDEKGLEAHILRPTALLGPPDWKPSRFGRTIQDLYTGKLPLISSGGYDLLDIRDFSQTVINSLNKGRNGEIYLTGGKFYSLKKLASLVNPSRVPPVISIDLLLFILPLIRLYQKFVPLRWPINRESLMTIKRGPEIVDSSKAEKYLDHRTRPLEESINDLILWMKNTEKL